MSKRSRADDEITAVDDGANEGGKRVRNTSTLQSLSVKLARMTQESRSKFSINGSMLDHILLAGYLIDEDRSDEESKDVIRFNLKDAAGDHIIPFWIYKDSFPDQKFALETLKNNVIIHTIGKLTKVNETKIFMPKKIMIVHDMNQLIVHEKEVILHSTLRANALPSSSARKFAVVDTSPMKTKPSSSSRNASSGGGGGMAISSGGTVINLEQRIRTFVGKFADDNQGCSMDELVNHLATYGYSSDDVEQKYDVMCEDGLIYTTVDDKHFKISAL